MATPAAPDAPAAPPPKPPPRPQTPEELAFYARDHKILTIIAIIMFPPLGLLAYTYHKQVEENNKYSQWEEAYNNSFRTVWVDVFAILAGLGIIYTYFLLL